MHADPKIDITAQPVVSSDTIVALSTPSGIAALAVIRLSGPESRGIVEKLVATKDSSSPDWKPGHAVYRTLFHQGQTLDDVVLTFWQAPHSYTGEDAVEISCHGNPHIVENILRACLELGARTARPGEFTQRAFINDKLSLTQAEGLLDLLYAPTERALASARAMKEGRLGHALEEVRRELVDLLSHLEASLDFAEEGIEPRVGPEFSARVEKNPREDRTTSSHRAAGDEFCRKARLPSSSANRTSANRACSMRSCAKIAPSSRQLPARRAT